MPTLILVDNSLSMLNPFHEAGEPLSASTLTRKALAVSGISQFIHLLQQTNKYEFVSLATFSTQVRVLQHFTRDFASVILACSSFELDSKTVLGPAVRYASDECSTTWCSGSYCQIILVTDGLGMEYCTEDFDVLPFKFYSHLHIVCLSPVSLCRQTFCQDMKKLLVRNEQNTEEGLYFLEECSVLGVKRIFSEIVEKHYAPSFAVLKCGTFSTSVQLSPPSRPFKHEPDSENKEWTIGSTVEILGFLKPSELNYPPIWTRHLVCPLHRNDENVKNVSSKEPEKQANFCVLLHGSMTVSGMAAVCELSPQWYGIIFYLPDSKKSNLILNTLPPGINSVPWLGKLNQLSPRCYFPVDHQSDPFAVVTVKPKASYSVSSASWLESSSIHSDVQKLLRQARKIPDRQTQFYSELNKICRHSMAVGFPGLIQKISKLLEREANASTNIHVKKQLTYIAGYLRNKPLRYDEPIKSLK